MKTLTAHVADDCYWYPICHRQVQMYNGTPVSHFCGGCATINEQAMEEARMHGIRNITKVLRFVEKRIRQYYA